MACAAPFIFETRIRVIDTDFSGRIHYTCLFRYFEAAEIEFMRSLGVLYNDPQYGLPRVHVECDYRLALMHDDVIRIEVCLTKLGRSSLHLEFRVTKDDRLAANGLVVVVSMDRVAQCAVPIPEELRTKLAFAHAEAEGGSTRFRVRGH